jgi:hypothetical protein
VRLMLNRYPSPNIRTIAQTVEYPYKQ